MSALGNHLWQSTLFIGACWLAALLLKRNSASIRYSIWLAASVKFLFPVSILVGIGAYAGEFTDIRVVPEEWSAGLTVSPHLNAVEQPVFQTPQPRLIHTNDSGLAPGILVGGWLSGAAVIAIWFIVRWRRLIARIGKGALLNEGRELEALRRVQSRCGWAKRVRLASSASSVEPGVRGIVRPVLFLPAGITDRLAEDQLETIIAHELCHIRRRDNLASALHVIVQTIFWFHPLVWWIGSRLVDERERSCDEEVLKMGSDPRVYASAILRVCEFYLAAPLAMVSRVTGSNLTTRIEDIMTQRIIPEMGSGRRILLALAAFAFVATPVLFGMTQAPGAAPQRLYPTVPAIPAPSPAASVALKPAAPPAAPKPNPSPQVRPPATLPATTEYRLRPGDEVDILVWREPELTRRSVVRPDGKIGIPLAGDVPAEGLTPMDLKNLIQQEMAQFVSSPLVSIIVAAPRKSQVTIQGAIVRPGVYSLEGRQTVLQLIAEAGGLSEFAQRDKISVFREEGGVVRRYLFNYQAYLAGANLDQNIVLKEDDIVIVP